VLQIKLKIVACGYKKFMQIGLFINIEKFLEEQS